MIRLDDPGLKPLAALLRDLADMVESGDCIVGRVEWQGLLTDELAVRAVFRAGMNQGQGYISQLDGGAEWGSWRE
jgi:hypothetical protein